MRLLPFGLALVLLAPGCLSPRLDAPAKTRVDLLGTAPWTTPLFEFSESPDATSWRWSAVLGLFGAEAEEQRSLTKVLPFWWQEQDPPSGSTTLLFPLYYATDEGDVTHTRWYSLLWGTYDSPEERQDHVLASIFRWKRSRTTEAWSSGLFPVYNWDHRAGVDQLTVVPLFGLAHLATFEWGLPAEGVTAGALGRSGSRRFELVDILGAISLVGYDDVGDRTEYRLVSLFDSEVLSVFRSWRARADDDPFVNEWLFPLYMNVAGNDGSWSYVGPLWGHSADAPDMEGGSRTDWWLLGLLTRNRDDAGTNWRVLGLPIWSDR